MKTIQHFVGGKEFLGDSKRVGKVFNPATGEQSATVKLATTDDVNKAVVNAKKAKRERIIFFIFLGLIFFGLYMS